jgi:hypothetical protein
MLQHLHKKKHLVGDEVRKCSYDDKTQTMIISKEQECKIQEITKKFIELKRMNI